LQIAFHEGQGERISILRSFLMLTLLTDLKTGGMKYLAAAPITQNIFVAAQLLIVRHLGKFFEVVLYEFPIFNIGYGRQQALRLVR
jgi:hypothetical protein